MLTAIVFVAPFDDRSILGLNPWIKPSKFLISVAIHVWTVAWVLDYVREARTARRAISIGVATVMVLEIACIVLQSARGVRSHFNAATAFDQTVFALMAFGIFANTALLALLGWLLFTRHRDLPRPYLWAVRLGVLLILLGSAGGFVMIGSRGSRARPRWSESAQFMAVRQGFEHWVEVLAPTTVQQCGARDLPNPQFLA